MHGETVPQIDACKQLALSEMVLDSLAPKRVLLWFQCQASRLGDAKLLMKVMVLVRTINTERFSMGSFVRVASENGHILY